MTVENICPDLAGGDIPTNPFNSLVGHERQIHLVGEGALAKEIERFPVSTDEPTHQIARQRGLVPYFVRND